MNDNIDADVTIKDKVNRAIFGILDLMATQGLENERGTIILALSGIIGSIAAQSIDPQSTLDFAKDTAAHTMKVECALVNAPVASGVN